MYCDGEAVLCGDGDAMVFASLGGDDSLGASESASDDAFFLVELHSILQLGDGGGEVVDGFADGEIGPGMVTGAKSQGASDVLGEIDQQGIGLEAEESGLGAEGFGLHGAGGIARIDVVQFEGGVAVACLLQHLEQVGRLLTFFGHDGRAANDDQDRIRRYSFFGM